MMWHQAENSSETENAAVGYRVFSMQSITSLTRLRSETKIVTMLAAATKVGDSHPKSASDPARSWKKIVEPVEPFLAAVKQRLMEQSRTFDPQIIPYAEQALNNGGKNLRPTLVALAAGCFGQPKETHVTAAVIIEMIHLATLVHDDVMDEAEIRRGQPTLAATCGNEIAVLFGDCLFAHALKLASDFPTTDICRAVSLATNTVCSGEILQTQQRRKFAAARQDYFRVIGMKTGELFTLSCDLAAFLSEAPPAQRAALKEFGAAVGTAYQIYDDCVDLFGREADAGKSLGTDLAKGKLTWPLLLAWERASAADRAALEKMIAGWQPENFPVIKGLLAQYDTFAPSVAEIERYLDIARRALRVVPASPGQAGLFGLTEFLAQQTANLAV
jgi:octaprenyl-diphosphate synthase